MDFQSKEKEGPRYLQIYEYYKELIRTGKLEAGTKIPSIRKGAEQFQISRTTLESAYMLLMAEGYIMSRPQSGFFVTDIMKKRQPSSLINTPKKIKHKDIQYDFATANVDRQSFRFDLWRRYMKNALRQDERLFSYGEPQGEREFRQVLCEYLQKNRNVICSEEQIVIGAGVQSLLHILCSILDGEKKVAFQSKRYVQGQTIFQDHGYEILDEYKDARTAVYYMSPSYLWGRDSLMSVQERMDLIRESQERHFLIIEDDYNSEFRYFQRPVPSIQGLAGGTGVVYLGTFSKMLLPSIRMSYMVLPPEMTEKYEERKNRYNQTASKAEQIAITQFIRDGQLERQIRKSRKIHIMKSEALKAAVEEIFGNRGSIQFDEGVFSVLLQLETRVKAKQIAEKLLEHGVAVIALDSETEGKAEFLLSSTNVDVKDYKEALLKIKECI